LNFTLTPSLRETLYEALSDTLEHYVHVQHMAVLLPVTGEMFARLVTSRHPTSHVIILTVWLVVDLTIIAVSRLFEK